VEAYVRYVLGWATIPNIRCKGQLEIDLLAIDPVKLDRYHIETSVSSSSAFSRLTAVVFDPQLLKERTQKPIMRRTLGYFIQNKFGPDAVIERLRDFGFSPDNHVRVVVTWGWTPEAKREADKANIKLWDFRKIMQKIADHIRDKRSYFTDDTLRTIHLFVHALPNGNEGSEEAKPKFTP
jgi:hypothetical protein